MIKGRENLNYNYYNHYLKNCGSEIPDDIEIIYEFFISKLNILDGQEIDPKQVILLNEFMLYVKRKTFI